MRVIRLGAWSTLIVSVWMLNSLSECSPGDAVTIGDWPRDSGQPLVVADSSNERDSRSMMGDDEGGSGNGKRDTGARSGADSGASGGSSGREAGSSSGSMMVCNTCQTQVDCQNNCGSPGVGKVWCCGQNACYVWDVCPTSSGGADGGTDAGNDAGACGALGQPCCPTMPPCSGTLRCRMNMTMCLP
jgi:hypothetical protein